MPRLNFTLNRYGFFSRLVNVIQPGCVKKVNESAMAFKCMENINNFLQVAKEFGVPDQETFQTVDLWERQNLNSVVICLQSMGRKVSKQINQYLYPIDFLNGLFHICRLENSVNHALDPKRQKRTNVTFLKSNYVLVKE